MKTSHILALAVIMTQVAFPAVGKSATLDSTATQTQEVVYQKVVFPFEKYQAPSVYFNNHWFREIGLEAINPDVIINISVDKEEAPGKILVEIPETEFELLQEKAKALNVDSIHNDRPLCIFPGGYGQMYNWIKENTQVPEGFEGYCELLVGFKVSPDGSVSDASILRGKSDNEAVNQEAIRIVNSMPSFLVEYYTPDKYPLYLSVPITIRSPGAVPGK